MLQRQGLRIFFPSGAAVNTRLRWCTQTWRGLSNQCYEETLMIEHSKGSSNRQSAHHTVVERIHEIYANHDQSAAHEITKLLVNVLRRSNYRSRLALIRFFDVSRMSQTKSAPQLDLVLIASARLLINGLNAHRVQDWISGYEGSAARSERRSLYERILRDFVASRTAVEAMKSQVRATRTLATDVRSKCDALKRLIKSMPGNADVPANAANGRSFGSHHNK